MKINDIILKEGIFDTFKKDYQKWNTDRGIQKASEVGARAWKNNLAKLERAKDGQPLYPQQLKQHLKKWIDQSLFGSYSLKTSPQTVQNSVNTHIKNLVSNSKNDAKLQQAFTNIMERTSRLVLDGDAEQDPNKQTATGKKVCGDQPVTVSGDSLVICGKELKKGEPGHAELAKKLGIAK